jgi:LysR family transcriptional regulator, benzoate and cis,cis-muconate-responsive activator of ben and cat genes
MDGLIAVVTVAQEGSIERATKVLNLGRSTVDKQILTVEAEAGAELFDRHGGRWILNEKGKLFARKASQSILYARMALELVQSHVKLETSRLLVGYSTFLHPQLIDIIKHIELEKQKDVQIVCESWLTGNIWNAVLQGEFHIGFGFLPIEDPELLVHQVFEEPLVVCLPKDHRLSMKDKDLIRPEELEGLQMIAVGRRAHASLFEQKEDHFRFLGLRLSIVEECFSPNEALSCVAQGNHVCLLPVSEARASDKVIVKPLSDLSLTQKSGIFVRQDHDDAIVEEYLTIVRKTTNALQKSLAATRK